MADGPRRTPGKSPAPRAGTRRNRLREATDRGETGDKIAAPDPATAPLGTDEEAGGHPTPDEAVTIPAGPARAHPGFHAGAPPGAPEDTPAPGGWASNAPGVANRGLLTVAVVAAAVVLLGLLVIGILA